MPTLKPARALVNYRGKPPVMGYWDELTRNMTIDLLKAFYTLP
jgi:hypothetical protein